MRGIVALLSLIVCIFAGIFLAFAIPISTVFYFACNSQASKMELEHSFGPLQDCMVKVDGKWMPLASYKVIITRPIQ